MVERHSIIPASYLILMKEEKILLLRRFNTGYQDGKYSFIAGHVDPSETFTDAVVREAKEEAGIDLDVDHLDLVHMMHRKSKHENEERIDAFFVAKEWKGVVKNLES